MIPTVDVSTMCASCNKPIVETDEAVVCPHCQHAHHRECWQAQGGCQRPHDTVDTLTLPVIPDEAERPVLHEQSATRQYLPWLLGFTLIAILTIGATVALQLGARMNTVLIIGVVIAALAFDYVNGMHDAGNAIATVISTRVLSPITALCMAAILNLLGALVHAGVASSIATKFADMHHIHPAQLTPVMILCGLVGASIWSYLTASWGLPVSTSHSLFGGLIGVFLLGGIPLNMEYLSKIGMWMVLAPVMAFSVGWALMLGMMWLFRNIAPYKLNKHFRFWQIISSAMMAFSHGSNDAQKAMGIITMALVSGGFLHVSAGADIVVPFWVKLACATVIALGTGLGGMRVIRTLGHKIIKLAPVHGFAAETVAAGTIQLVTFLKIPISTTHVISSSILGIGASKRFSAVRWGVASNIVIAWVFTIPTCAMAGALLYYVVRMLGMK